MNRTFVPKNDIGAGKWWLIDAEDQVLGRLATEIARLLQGRHKPEYTPYFNNGDFVVVVNAEKIRLTGAKTEQKRYYRHSGYLGGIKEISYPRMLAAHPERIIFNAVKGMMPKNRISRQALKKLKVFKGPEHRHTAQKPESINIQGGTR
ncbi:MAG: 50S ribosomal protein L13 [Candidatus Aminicenantes bacterium]|nr:50S ribosomal protein L13 [Candidatus Aminicenantes bacterium]